MPPLARRRGTNQVAGEPAGAPRAADELAKRKADGTVGWIGDVQGVLFNVRASALSDFLS